MTAQVSNGGLNARGSHSELRGKDALALRGRRAKRRGRKALMLPALLPTIYKAGNLGRFPLLESDV